MTGEAERLRRRFGPDDLRAAAEGLGVGRTVAVQAVGSVEETEVLLAVAGASDLVAGVVGWVDLTAPDVADALAPPSACTAWTGRPYLGRLTRVERDVGREASTRRNQLSVVSTWATAAACARFGSPASSAA